MAPFTPVATPPGCPAQSPKAHTICGGGVRSGQQFNSRHQMHIPRAQRRLWSQELWEAPVLWAALERLFSQEVGTEEGGFGAATAEKHCCLQSHLETQVSGASYYINRQTNWMWYIFKKQVCLRYHKKSGGKNQSPSVKGDRCTNLDCDSRTHLIQDQVQSRLTPGLHPVELLTAPHNPELWSAHFFPRGCLTKPLRCS